MWVQKALEKLSGVQNDPIMVKGGLFLGKVSFIFFKERALGSKRGEIRAYFLSVGKRRQHLTKIQALSCAFVPKKAMRHAFWQKVGTSPILGGERDQKVTSFS